MKAVNLLTGFFQMLWALFMALVSFVLTTVGLQEARPVSMPPPARPHRTFRLPEWKTGSRKTKLAANWTFATDKESHKITEAELKASNVLSGESAGRQIWYATAKTDQKNNDAETNGTFDPSVNPNTSDLLFREQMLKAWKGAVPDSKTRPKTANQAVTQAIGFYQMLQTEDGHWAGDYGGPMFLMPGLIIACYICGGQTGLDSILGKDRMSAMVTYLRNHQQQDGGWGTHIESPSTMFGSAMNYVALRLLGVSADDEAAVHGRTFIKANKGIIYTSSWAKFWLATIGLYDWAGINSIPAEMWLLPEWIPFHPSKLWCHCRMVYLPMCYLYCTRFTLDATKDPLLMSLRKELYVEDYDTIDWDSTRHLVCDFDNYSAIHPVMKFMHDVLSVYEVSPIKWLRKKAVEFAYDYIQAEDIQTNYVDIGPVNKCLNMVCVYLREGKDSPQFKKHVARVADYLWVAEDGMKMQGYNGSQCWDTCFAMQAVIEGQQSAEFPEMTQKVWNYLERTQILSTPVSQGTPAYGYETPANRIKYFRHVSKGGWPFSTSAHGWPISDCTAEGLKTVLGLRKLAVVKDCNPISDERLYDAVNVLLSYQNESGGWATYENNRGYGWYEALNPSEVFGDIMIDYSYVECSSASITALRDFHQQFPNHRSAEIKQSLKRGAEFLMSIQRKDGSWYGSWACCFTYACWFGIEGLLACDYDVEHPSIKKAEAFLLSHQNENGGWGEDFSSCYDRSYSLNGAAVYGDEKSGVIQTAWALLALMAAESKDTKAVHKGIQYLMSRQLDSGDWAQEGITGVFNRACGITYTSYRNVFPIWALGKYTSHYAPNHM